MGRKPIVVSKIGYDHSFQGVNRQDFGSMFGNVKLSLDGCSSGKFSEIGVGLFAQALAKRSNDITDVTFERIALEEMSQLVSGLHFTDQDLFDNFCFTILAAVETDSEFIVFSCGDGYIFAITKEGHLEITNVDCGYNNYPPYFVYNLMDPDSLSAYKTGVDFTIHHFPKTHYQNVGVGSDGYQYAERLGNVEKITLEDALLNGKPGRIGQVINRNALIFKDDITIVL